jgi:adenylosuccinate synthase
MLDLDFGTYPFVTSSSAAAGGACTGSGVAPNCIDRVVGVVKAYTTRVGEGPFPTELFDADGEKLRAAGREYGATTGRPRRCGWFDAVVARWTRMLCGVDEWALTKLDVLDGFDEIKVCTAYELDGKTLMSFPARASDVARVKPVYETFPGWKTETGNVTEFSQLPQKARDYVKALEEITGAPTGLLSIGPRRDSTLILPAHRAK